MLDISIHPCPDTPLRPILNSAHATALSISNATSKDVTVTVFLRDSYVVIFTADYKTGIITEKRS